VIGQFPFDWVGIDLEHSPYASYESVEQLCRSADLAGLTPIASIAESNAAQIGKLCEAGIMGFIVPRTIDSEDAERAIRAAKYPPIGNRSAATAVRQAGYSFNPDGWRAIADELNNQIAIIGKIEDIEAIENLDDILSTSIDGLVVGSFDLSHSLARALGRDEIRGEVAHPKVIEARNQVFAKCKEHGKFSGAFFGQLQAQEKPKVGHEITGDLVRQGVLVYSMMHDLSLLAGAYRSLMAEMGWTVSASSQPSSA